VIIAWIIVFSLIFLFSFVVVFGAPYAPTLKRQQRAALELLNLRPGQVFYDLGCGDGRLLISAAQAGYRAVGYEINPILALIAYLRTRRFRGRVKIVWGNFWRADITDADAVFVFLIERHMRRLDKFLSRQFKHKPVKVISYAFKIPQRKIAAERGAIFLYQY
jgi:SAM-dependent methyltransferase